MMTRAIFILSLLMSVLCKPQAQVMMLFSSDSLFNITSPLDLDSLFYWFAADVGVTDSLGGAIANNEGVGTWNDLSGNGYHVTQTTNGARPVYKATGGPGSKPCIQFDGSNDRLLSSDVLWESDDITVFVVMKWASATRNIFEIVLGHFDAASSERQWAYLGGNSTTSPSYIQYLITSDNGTNALNNFTTNSKHTNFKCNVWVYNSGTFSFFSDGSAATGSGSGTGDGTIYNYTQKLSIGANSAGSIGNLLQGSISEIIVYSRALSATERAAIENYLNKKYDLY